MLLAVLTAVAAAASALLAHNTLAGHCGIDLTNDVAAEQIYSVVGHHFAMISYQNSNLKKHKSYKGQN